MVRIGLTSPLAFFLYSVTDCPVSLVTHRFPAESSARPVGTDSPVLLPRMVRTGLTSPFAFFLYSVTEFWPALVTNTRPLCAGGAAGAAVAASAGVASAATGTPRITGASARAARRRRNPVDI